MTDPVKDRLASLSEAKRRLLARWLHGTAPTEPLPRSPGGMDVAEMARRARLAPDVDPQNAREPASGLGPVLLTGATGFFGAFLLDALVEAGIPEVHCLVRAADEDEGRARILANLDTHLLSSARAAPHVRPVVGNLERPRLGLGPASFERLAADVVAVYHCGALVKWTYPYPALEAANVAGTHEVLRLASTRRRKPVHFISTVGVFASPDRREPVREDTPLETSGPLYVGYAQTKWVAEKLVWIAAERGLPVTVHRPNLGGDSTTGAFNPHDHVCQMLGGCIQMGCAPALDFDVAAAPVDFAGRAVVAVAGKPECRGRAFHLVNPRPRPWHDIVQWFRQCGYGLETLPYEAWKEVLSETVRQRLDHMLRRLAPFFSDDLLDHTRLPHFEATRTREALSEDGLVCPPLDARLLGVYLQRFVDTGFLPSPPTGEGREALVSR